LIYSNQLTGDLAALTTTDSSIKTVFKISNKEYSDIGYRKFN